MIEGFSPLGPLERTGMLPRLAPAAKPLPATPPPDVLKALGRAQHVIAELEEMRVELRFTLDSEHSRICVKVMDADGTIIREIPAMQALGVLSGDHPTGLLLDARG